MGSKVGRPFGSAHDERTRQKIQTSQLINRLVSHALGNVEMSQTQVTAALGLLRKTLPDLSAAEIKQETIVQQIGWEPLDADEWKRKYGMGAPAGSTERPN